MTVTIAGAARAAAEAHRRQVVAAERAEREQSRSFARRYAAFLRELDAPRPAVRTVQARPQYL